MEEEKVKSHHRERVSSYELLPPYMSELRLVLLGNSWSGTCSVGNLLLGQTVFRHSDRCEKSSGQYRGKNMVLVKTPDLLHLSEASVSALMKNCVELSAPGPHVFILVLQPEDFTEQQKTRLQSVLENFSDQAFGHSLLLFLPSRRRAADSFEHYRRESPLKDFIKQCRFRYIKQKDLEQLELITRVGQIVKENNGEHVSTDALHLTPQAPVNFQTQSDRSGLKMILLGNSWSQRSSVGNLLLKKIMINTENKPLNFQTYEGEMHNQPLTVVNTPDLQDTDISDFTDCIRRLSGPLVFLLVLQPEDFTEKHKYKLCSVLQSCSDKAFDQSLVLISMGQAKTGVVQKSLRERDQDDQLIRDMIINCKYRYLYIKSTDDPNQKEFTREELFTRIGQMLKENKENLSCGPSQEKDKGLNLAASEENRPCLNLVLCGRAGAEKSSVVESIFGRGSVCLSPEQCVSHQGKVCGRWVSLLELPPMAGSGEPEEKLMEQCLSFLSRCGPQGVQAFILVLPLNPLTDEDKSELRSIQEVFSSAVCPFTLILFTVDSDSYHPDVEGSDLQELCQPYGGHLIFNTRGQHQVDMLLDSLETFAKNKAHSYTTETLIYGQRRMITTVREIQDLQVKRTVSGPEASADCLRITLVGRTGHGKSSSGNTILGRTQFRADFSQVSVTQSCEKAETEVDGRSITVVDTPGLFHSRMSNDDIIDEMTKCVSLLAPGPHVFLLVLELGRFTEDDNMTIDLIRKSFGKDSQKYTMILFTHGDKLKGKSSIEEFIRRSDSSLKKVLSDCGNRFHVFNSKDKTNVSQVKELLKKIDAMVEENGGGCFTNDMFQYAEVTIKKEMERIMKEKEEEMRREREEMERKYQQQVEDIKQQMEKQKEQIETEIKEREKELRKKEEKIKIEEELRKKDQEKREEEERKRREKEERQRQELEQKQKEQEEKIKTESESKEAIKQKLEESRRKMEEQREKWEKEREEWWQKRKQEDEEKQQYIKNLREEYDKQRLKDQEQRREEDRIRKLQEEEIKRKYQQEMEDIKQQMEKHKEQTEKDRKQREQELREKEEKIKMEEKLRKEMERIVKEKEEKMRREREEMERKYQHELKEIKQEMDKQKEQMKKEIKEKEQELREKEEKIKIEEELRKKDQEKREEEETKRREQEERQRQELEQKQKELELKIQSESASKEAIEQKLQESRRKMEEQREKWEKDREKWWQQRKEENEEKEKQSKAREAKQRQEWEQKQKELEEKIKSESESKEAIEQKLEESRRKMEEQREKWENEREEWWQKRKQEDEERRQYIKNLCEEYSSQRLKDQEQRREEDRIRKQQEAEIKRKYKQEIEDIELQMEKHKEQTEKHRKQREQELREKEEKIKMEEEHRKKEQEKREEEETKRREQEEQQRQELEQKQKELEEKIKSESESKEAIVQKLQESRRKMEEQREKWENEREEWQQKRKLEDVEKQQYIQKLHEEYDRQRLKDQEQRREEDRIRKLQEEENIKELKKKYEKEIEESKKASEKEARTRAEEEFQRKEKEKLEEHRKNMNDLVECICRKERNVKRINKKIKANKEQMEKEKDEEKKEALLKDQEKELSELIQEMLEEEEDSRLHKILKSLMSPLVYQVFENWLVETKDEAQGASTSPDPTFAGASSPV